MSTVLHPTALRKQSTSGSHDISESLTVTLEASAPAALEAVYRLDLADPAVRALHALGIGDRVALAPSILAASPGVLVLGFVWSVADARPAAEVAADAFDTFDTPGHVKVRWEIRVEDGEGDRSYLSVSTRFAATDEFSRKRLLDGWGVIGAFSKVVSQRAVATVKAYLDHMEDELAA